MHNTVLKNVNEILEYIKNEAKRLGAKRVYLFGSRAQGTNKSNSDIDILVEGLDEDKTHKLRVYANEILETPYRIDVVRKESLEEDKKKAFLECAKELI